jgi:hypothetical protein
MRSLQKPKNFVDAKDEAAIAFYRQYGFIEVPKKQNRLFLPMATVSKMFA